MVRLCHWLGTNRAQNGELHIFQAELPTRVRKGLHMQGTRVTHLLKKNDENSFKFTQSMAHFLVEKRGTRGNLGEVLKANHKNKIIFYTSKADHIWSDNVIDLEPIGLLIGRENSKFKLYWRQQLVYPLCFSLGAKIQNSNYTDSAISISTLLFKGRENLNFQMDQSGN